MCLHNAGQKSCDANKIDPSKYIYTTFTNCQTLACFFQYNQDVKQYWIFDHVEHNSSCENIFLLDLVYI